MGQYHLIVNFDKREYLHPHHIGSGLKLWEMLNNETPGAALIALLATANGRGGGDLKGDPVIGRWAGDRIAVVGDYGNDGDFSKDLDPEPSSVYYRCLDEGETWEGEKSLPIYRSVSGEVQDLLRREVVSAGEQLDRWGEITGAIGERLS